MTTATFQRNTDGNSAGSSVDANIRNHLNTMGANTLVTVIAVNAGDGITGTVDVQPMVHMQTSDGTAIPHGTIYGVPYLRVQGGSCALIVDPVVGDIGYIIISGRDQSNAVANRAPSSPGSFRTHSMSDCVYVGAYLGSDPEHYVKISTSGVNIVTTGTVSVTAASMSIGCDVAVQGNITASGDVVAGSVSLKSHTHGGVQSGSSRTTGPA